MDQIRKCTSRLFPADNSKQGAGCRQGILTDSPPALPMSSRCLNFTLMTAFCMSPGEVHGPWLGSGQASHTCFDAGAHLVVCITHDEPPCCPNDLALIRA
eukprot:1156100-Pelagomonas_calceolata.AAC.5